MCEMVLDTQVSVGSECPDIKPSRVVVYFSFDISFVIDQIFSLRAVESTRNHYSSRDYMPICYEQKHVANVNPRLLWQVNFSI